MGYAFPEQAPANMMANLMGGMLSPPCPGPAVVPSTSLPPPPVPAANSTDQTAAMLLTLNDSVENVCNLTTLLGTTTTSAIGSVTSGRRSSPSCCSAHTQHLRSCTTSHRLQNRRTQLRRATSVTPERARARRSAVRSFVRSGPRTRRHPGTRLDPAHVGFPPWFLLSIDRRLY